MRFTPASIALAALLTTVSSVGFSQRPDSQISPQSVEWQKAGEAARKAGNLEGATDARFRSEARRLVDEATEFVEQAPYPSPDGFFDHVYAGGPPSV